MLPGLEGLGFYVGRYMYVCIFVALGLNRVPPGC